MAIPAYSDILLPLLQFAGDGHEHHIRDAIEAIADYMGLSEEERTYLMQNGNQTVFSNRTHWANTYLKKAGLLRSTGRGLFQITERGLNVLDTNPATLTRNDLLQFDEFLNFVQRGHNDEQSIQSIDDDEEQTPKELMQNLTRKVRKELAEELLEYVLSVTPAFFEKLVVDLLLAMGYGGTLDNAGQAIGRSGDGGVDGYIQEDKLGLSTIYIQAKRWALDRTIGRPDIQGFVGSVMGQGATKGVFITTSKYSPQAEQYVHNLPNVKIILIDGTQLAQLMIEHNVGVSVDQTFVIKRVDTDYFDAN